MNSADKMKVLEEKIVSFEIVKKDLSRTKKDFEEAAQKIDLLENQLQTTNSLKEALESDMKSLLHDLDCERNFAEEYKRRIGGLETELVNYENVKSQLAEEKTLKEDANKKNKLLENELDSEKVLKESIQSDLESALATIETLKKEKDQMSAVYKEVTEKNHMIEEMRAELDSIEGERTEALEKIQELNDRLDTALSQREESEYELQQLKEAMESITGALAATAEEPPQSYDLNEE
jgi:chromosome segregation ATPase